jgi:hypothetical protein
MITGRQYDILYLMKNENKDHQGKKKARFYVLDFRFINEQ